MSKTSLDEDTVVADLVAGFIDKNESVDDNGGLSTLSGVETVTTTISLKSRVNKMKWKVGVGGYSPNVLYTALHFLKKYDGFDNALTKSVQFAGAANYCPVLVG